MATETWVLNETLSTAGNSLVRVDISFISNGESFSYIRYIDEGMDLENQHLRYGGVSVYYSAAWTNEAYRTITFTQPVTDTTLLAWLQANGTKQAPKVTVDLTSLSGYESLPAGTYALSVCAKAAGYQDSDLSSTVSFTKLAVPVVTAADTTVTWDAVSNAESYDEYVDGELYENTTGGASGETWLLNSSISGGSENFSNLSFVCDSLQYDSIYVATDEGSVSDVSYGNSSPYRLLSAYDGDSGWYKQVYRTLTFSTPPTGNLLTWLQSNGTKQP